MKRYIFSSKSIFFKSILILALAFYSQSSFGQFGFTMGLNSAKNHININENSINLKIGSEIYTGLNFSVSHTTPVNNHIDVRPEIGIFGAFIDKRFYKDLIVGLPFLFNIGESNFYLHFGPMMGLTLEEKITDMSNIFLGGTTGISYYISNKVYLQMKYYSQLSNSYIGENDVKVTGSHLNLSFGIELD